MFESTHTLTAESAIRLKDYAIIRAGNDGVKGFVAVYGSDGTQLTSEVVGGANKINVAITEAKAQSVLATKRSTSAQRNRMAEKGQNYDYFAGQLGSLFGGGLPIFADHNLTQFVGAIAFSGGTEDQDEKICLDAIDTIELYTDVQPKPSLVQVYNELC